MNRAIVYVQIQHDLPRCLWSSLLKARELWDGDIYVIAPAREMDYPAYKELNIKYIPRESMDDDDMLREYEKHTFFHYPNWDGFWDNVCKRFVYLYLLQRKYGIDELIHIETDVVPYVDINGMWDAFNRVYGKKIVFIPYGSYQHNCSFMYCNSQEILESFCMSIIDYFKRGLEHFWDAYPGESIINETHFAYTYQQENDENVGLFPAMPGDDHFDELGFLIDPHAWGMWVDGRQRIPGKPCAVMTQHIGAKILEGKYDVHFSFRNGKVVMPYVHDKIESKSYPLATLHFNSKRAERWI